MFEVESYLHTVHTTDKQGSSRTSDILVNIIRNFGYMQTIKRLQEPGTF